jgi:hypothetical protein
MRMNFKDCLQVSLGAFTFLLMAPAIGYRWRTDDIAPNSLYASLDPPQSADANLLIFNVPAGWVEGPRIKGKILPPTAEKLFDLRRRKPGA